MVKVINCGLITVLAETFADPNICNPFFSRSLFTSRVNCNVTFCFVHGSYGQGMLRYQGAEVKKDADCIQQFKFFLLALLVLLF